MDRKLFWTSVGSVVATALGGVVLQIVGLLETRTAVLLPMYVSSGVGLVCVAYLGWRHWPSVRKRRQFKELAGDLADASADLVGGMDARVAQGDEDRINESYARLQLLLAQLRQQFGIPIPADPFELIVAAEHEKFARLVACARNSDLKGARQVFG